MTKEYKTKIVSTELAVILQRGLAGPELQEGSVPFHLPKTNEHIFCPMSPRYLKDKNRNANVWQKRIKTKIVLTDLAVILQRGLECPGLQEGSVQQPASNFIFQKNMNTFFKMTY